MQMLIRLVHLGYVKEDFYWNNKKSKFDKEEADYKQYGRAEYYGTRYRNTLGDLYTKLVLQAWSLGRITNHAAAELMGIKNLAHLHDIHDHAAVLCAFDLIELDGTDLRSTPIEQRKRALADLLHRERDCIVLNVHYDCDGAMPAAYNPRLTMARVSLAGDPIDERIEAFLADVWRLRAKMPMRSDRGACGAFGLRATVPGARSK
jgi:hypothetical protein